MDDNYKMALLSKITSHEIINQRINLHEITEVALIIQDARHKKKDQYSNEILYNSNLLYQKTLLHGLSILVLSKGIDINLPKSKFVSRVNDPISISILVRGLLEAYLTFYHINFALNDDEKTVSHISWIIYGMKQRLKLKFEKPDENLHHTDPDMFDKFLKMYEANIQRLAEEREELNKHIEFLKQTSTFSKLDHDSQRKYINQLNSNWKFEYFLESYRPIGYQEILDKVGIRISSFDNIYNFLSWPAHSTSIGISQFADLWGEGRPDQLFMNNALIYSCVFLALMSRDVIINDPDFRIGYDAISQQNKDLLNFYNYYFRGNDFTIDKIDKY